MSGLGVPVLLAALLLAACSSNSSTGSSGGGTTTTTSVTTVGNQVTIKGFAFTPSVLQVKVGTTVVWTQEDGTPHTVTSGTPGSPTNLFESGQLAKGAAFRFTFTKPGNYPYFCANHTSMTGEVRVS
jgi:plastocyanin